MTAFCCKFIYGYGSAKLLKLFKICQSYWLQFTAMNLWTTCIYNQTVFLFITNKFICKKTKEQTINIQTGSKHADNIQYRVNYTYSICYLYHVLKHCIVITQQNLVNKTLCKQIKKRKMQNDVQQYEAKSQTKQMVKTDLFCPVVLNTNYLNFLASHFSPSSAMMTMLKVCKSFLHNGINSQYIWNKTW